MVFELQNHLSKFVRVKNLWILWLCSRRFGFSRSELKPKNLYLAVFKMQIFGKPCFDKYDCNHILRNLTLFHASSSQDVPICLCWWKRAFGRSPTTVSVALSQYSLVTRYNSIHSLYFQRADRNHRKNVSFKLTMFLLSVSPLRSGGVSYSSLCSSKHEAPCLHIAEAQ